MARPRVLYVPSPVSFGPYRSLVRLEQSIRATLAASFEPVDWDGEPAPVDAVVDLGASLAHAGRVGSAPTLLFALGNLPVGATLLWRHRTRLRPHDVVVVNCSADLAIAERVIERGGPRLELLPLGADTACFRPRGAAADRERRRELGLAEDDFVLVYSGRFDAQKNVHGLLALLRELVPLERRARLLLAGAFGVMPHVFFPERRVDDYERELHALIARWGLEDRVSFLGSLDDEALARTLSAADAFVTLTLHSNENFGYAPVEAMAAGLPTVVAHWGGLKDTVVHGVTGFHVETAVTGNGPRAAFRQAIAPLRALARDPDLRKRLGAAGRERALRLYSDQAFAPAFGSAIETAIASARREPDAAATAVRFRKEALAHWLGDIHGAARGHHGAREMDDFRFFQEPYATRDVSHLALGDEDGIGFVVRSQLDRRARALISLDPLWPDRLELTSAELELVDGLEPGATVAALLERGRRAGLSVAEARALLGRLLERGFVLPAPAAAAAEPG